MFGKKNKNSYDKILKQFNQYNSAEELKKYDELKSVYEEIRRFYEKKFNDNAIELKIEKIRIERNLGKQFGVSIGYIITFGISIMGAIISISIQETLKNISPHYWILNFIVIISLYFLIMSSIGKEAEKARPRDIMLNISLRVIEELEKEINENKMKQNEEANRKELFRQISQYIDSSNMIKNIMPPVVAEIAATTELKKGIISNLINNIRKK